MKKTSRLYLLLTVVFTIFIIPGCHKKHGPLQANSQEPVTHIVKYSGESLSIIANWYTGKSSNWQAVLDANPDLKSPQKLKLGSTIIVPADLVIQRAPLPKSSVTKFSPKATPTPNAAPAEPNVTAAPAAPSEPTAAPEAADTPAASKPEQSPAPEVTDAAPTAAPVLDTPTPAPAAEISPIPELPTPSPSEIARDTLIDEILSEKPN